MVRAVAANDSGPMMNPNNIANQIEGGIVQSLSWALKEEVRFDETQVLSKDWASYPILTFAEVPTVEVHLIDAAGGDYLGTGETAQGPAVGTLANAIADATGNRLSYDFPRLLCDREPLPGTPYAGQRRGTDREWVGRSGPCGSVIAPVFSHDLNG